MLQAGFQRLQQHAEAEHLRRLREPLVVARNGGGNTGGYVGRQTVARQLALERIRQGNGQQASRFILRASLDQALDLFARDQAARRIVHQHPVVRLRPLLTQCQQAIAHAFGAAGTAGERCHEAAGRHFGRRAVLCKPVVSRREDQQGFGDGGAGSECRQRVPEHGAAGDGLVLLGDGRAGTTAGAGAGDDSVDVGHARIFHWVQMLVCQSRPAPPDPLQHFALPYRWFHPVFAPGCDGLVA